MRVRILSMITVCTAVLALCSASFIHVVASASPLPAGTDLAFAQIQFVDSNGAPLAGTQIQVRRIPFGNQPVGKPIVEPIVGTGTTDASGHMLVKMAAPTVALLHAQDDVVNYEIDLVGASGLPVTVLYTGRYYGPDKNRQARFSKNLAQLAEIRLTADQSQLFHSPTVPGTHAKASPNCDLVWVVVADSDAYTTVGELHDVPNFSYASFSYGQVADSSIGVGWSTNGGSTWGLNGTIDISNSNQVKVTKSVPGTGNWYGYHQDALFHYQKSRQWYCVDWTNTYRILATQWDGGMQQGAYEGNYDNVPNQYTIKVDTYSTWQRISNNAATYSGGVTVWGARLSAQSGYSASVEAMWQTQSQKGYLYGNNTWPSSSGWIYASTYCPSGNSICA